MFCFFPTDKGPEHTSNEEGMKKFPTRSISKLLSRHKEWLLDHTKGQRANLSRVDLSKVDLSGADLSKADLSGADLSKADLSGANLYKANLSKADLSGANLTRAYLAKADVSEANLFGANLSEANLFIADLSLSNLSGAKLFEANLSKADLSGANLFKAKIKNQNQIVPEIGPFYCFKKLKNNVIATLYVPRSAKRLGGLLGRKCRVSKVKVVKLELNGKEVDSVLDMHTGKLLYKVGSWVKPDSFNEDFRIECTNGIHVFITKEEAERY
jgi:hypothetical protein